MDLWTEYSVGSKTYRTWVKSQVLLLPSVAVIHTLGWEYSGHSGNEAVYVRTVTQADVDALRKTLDSIQAIKDENA